MEYKLKVFILIFGRKAFQAYGKQTQRPEGSSVPGAFVKKQGGHCG